MDTFDGLVLRTLDAYKSLLGSVLGGKVCFERRCGFEAAVGKGYSAKSIYRVRSQRKGTQLGISCELDVVVLALQRGDGTGDASLFSLNQVGVPAMYKSDWMPTKVLPRSKEGIHTEYFLPLASVFGNSVLKYAVCLDEITVSHTGELVHHCYLGMKPTAYSKALLFRRGVGELRVDRTVGYNCDTVRFGDPHSVYFTPTIGQNAERLIQFAGFLSVQEEKKVIDGV